MCYSYGVRGQLMNHKEIFYSRPPVDMVIIPNNGRTPEGAKLLSEIRELAKQNKEVRIRKRPKYFKR